MLILTQVTDSSGQDAQNSYASEDLKKMPEDSNKVIFLHQIANRLIYTQPDLSIAYSKQADSLAQALGFTKGQALALNSMGNANWCKGNLKEGLSLYLESKEIAEQIGDQNLVARNIGSMGLIYRSAADYEAALAAYRAALPMFFSLKNMERIAVTYNNMGKCYMEKGELDSAIHFYELSQPLAKVHRPNMVPGLTFNYADALFRKKDLPAAETLLEKSLQSARKFDDTRTIIRGKQLLSEIMLMKNEIDKAEVLAHQAVQAAEPTDVKELIYKSYATLANVYNAKKDFQNAYRYLNLYNQYKDSIQSEGTQEKLDFLVFEQQRREIEMLTKEKEMEQHIREKQRYLIYALLGLVVLIAVLAFVLYRSSRSMSFANNLLKRKNDEVKQQKEEITAQADKLQRLNHLKDKLFSIISHDLRSPLNTLFGSLSLIQNGLIKKEEFDYMLSEILKNVNYTTSLLDNLLHWAKTQLEGSDINKEKVNLKRLASIKVELLQNQAQHKNVQLVNKINENTYVYADEVMIQIVIQNLLSNAIKFCKPNDEIYLEVTPQGDQVIFSVKDTGLGMKEETLNKLFKESSFNSTTGTANEKGTGLGLLLCKDFVEKNGGTIWAESAEGQGSTFYFSLPVFHEAEVKKALASLN
ncbi:ATP-binding protein [Porifericola rhodea]|uniref:ATP-binding protein n=1 Tax=Porifericola rhodea TaxID=930972 RepID=UPI00266595B4|nr:ATP-binding protein [Porifericola rhodea]WKN30376.1 ATP-binding protein [Porifericola rhodea]